ncbi:MAG: BtpA/SgcQ family protein, partial [Archaeoglobaceae archaeon]
MEKTVICVVHLKPLPGSPLYESFDEVIEKALRDAKAIEEGGADALIVENFGDKPFFPCVGKETIASMTVVAWEIKKETNLGIGINVLRNDAMASIAIAKAVKADFVRINQFFFPSISPEGFLLGNAGKIL